MILDQEIKTSKIMMPHWCRKINVQAGLYCDPKKKIIDGSQKGKQ
jgi:hypothetical protein